MKKRKGSLLQRMFAVMLSAVLAAGMVWNAAPVTALAQEEGGQPQSVSGNGIGTPEEGTETEPGEGTDSENQKDLETGGTGETVTEGPDDGQETPEPVTEEENGQKTPEPVAEGETAPETTAGNAVKPETMAAQQGVMMAAESEVLVGSLAEKGWELTRDGILTIGSEEGMYNWSDNRSEYGIHVTRLEIQMGVKSIVDGVFFYCNRIAEITIPDSVECIEDSAFEGCTSLTSITLPDKLTGIGSGAFSGCSSLAEVTLLCTEPPTIGENVFDGCSFVTNNTQGIHVPEGTAQTYKDAWTDWAAFIADGAAPAEEHKHDDVTFTAWTKTDSLPDAAGCYYLTENVALTAIWNVPSGETTLCLNGKTIEMTKNDNWALSVGSGNTFKLYDCGGAGKITGKRGVSVGGGAFEMYGGSISDIQSGYAIVYIHDNGTFHMRGGKISGNQNNSAGGDFANYGLVSVGRGTFAMSGGEISENKKNTVGSVVLNSGGRFDMSGGKISGNQGSIIVGVKAEFHMSGGAVSGNANCFSGGIQVQGTMTAGGNAVITGNTDNNGEEKNLFINSGVFGIDASNPLADSAKIGVTTEPAPTKESPVNITGANDADYSSHFTSDSADYEIVNGESNEVQLVVKEESHTHNYGEWQHDDTQHWKACSCGDETGRGNHDYGDWITDQAATAAVAGTKHRDCRTCGRTETEIIPATGTGQGSGTVTPEVKPGENAPQTGISTPLAELEKLLLTEEEKQQVQNGANIRIVLTVQDAGNTVSASDKAAVQQALNGFTVGQYLNIDLYKLIGENRTDITETAEKIRIVITVPEALRNTDSGKTRTFAVIRVHDGGTEFLNDLDDSDSTITIETDRFSTYAVVYQDTANGGNSGNQGDNGGGNSGGNSGSGDNGSNNSGGNNGSNSGGGNSGNGDNGSNNSGDNGSSNNGGNNNGGNNNSGDNGSSNNGGNNSSSNPGNAGRSNAKPDSSRDSEPKTGDSEPVELYATLAMIAGFAYLLLYFTDRERGMTEETKKELVSRIIRWAKQGGRIRRYLALAAIFVLLVYYHSIGKKTCTEWKEIYGE